MALRRWISIDNNHPDVNYEGSWEEDARQFEGLFSGLFGKTQRRTTGRASMHFTFQGEGVSVTGTSRNETETTEAVQWECLVDGRVYAPPRNISLQNNFQYCFASDLEDTTHEFTMNIEATENSPLWIDRVEFYPSSDIRYRASLSNYSVALAINDTSFRYGPGWEIASTNRFAKFATVPSSYLEIEFIGTHFLWRSVYVSNQRSAQSRATYTLNGGTPVEFTVPGRQTDIGQYTLFETERLPRNKHHIKVVYEGFEAPLILNHLYIPDGDVLDRDPRILGPELDGLRIDPIPTSISTTPVSGPPVGAIVGGVVGGVVLLALIGLAAFFLRKRRATRQQQLSTVQLDMGATGFQPGPVFAAPVYHPAPAEGFNPATYAPNPPAPEHPMRMSSYYAPSTSNGPSSIVTSSAGVSSKAQLASTQPAPEPMFYQDSGVRFTSTNVDNAVPPVYSPN
ncbi:hypothetical protein FA15DRAFT_673655 [Coprinopsis marcescibilis]|uniref:Uncharacterized protein n=1 Tax=Coprinopsis marcescibilis TaxID=230819 RepID=A0A5C3KJ86_COPMA|nr:hypothetical protein FA15DRAFT_673655 [Coprinopsis marcescibilis]